MHRILLTTTQIDRQCIPSSGLETSVCAN